MIRLRTVTIVWQNGDTVKDSVAISADTGKIRDVIIEFLSGKKNAVMTKDWSDFGTPGDTIRIVE